jgi:HTH-type transcriptional regulator / antitoxin HigA
MAEVDRLLDADPKKSSDDYALLEFLSVLIEAYEDEHESAWPITSPQAIVDFMLEQKGMARGDLTELMGGRSRVSDFFAGKRDLSLNQVRALREVLGIPADLLVR